MKKLCHIFWIEGALDLTPRSEPKSLSSNGHSISSSAAAAVAAVAGLNAFPSFPFMHHNVVNTSTPMMTGALNSLAQSVAPMGPFNPMALTGMLIVDNWISKKISSEPYALCLYI